MNQNNIFNKNEIENKLKDFKEGEDYSISPTDEPNMRTYNFYNDKLRNMFRGDRVPVRIAREAYDGKDYTYRGHFEEGKDYRYSSQFWDYRKGNSSDHREVWNYPKPIEDWVKNALERGDIKKGINIYSEGGKIGENGLEKHWEGEEHFNKRVEDGEKYKNDNHSTGCCLCGFREINQSDKYCQKCGALLCDEAKRNVEYLREKPAKSSLEKENHDLRQQLSEVQKQLAEVLEELKKLKNNINGKGGEKLEQQIVKNERLIRNGENVSLAEVQEQVQKSQALMNEVNTTASSNKDNKGNGSLPYVIGGSVILAVAGIIGYFLVKKSKRS